MITPQEHTSMSSREGQPLPCCTHARAPRLAGARVGTIPLPVIAPPADPQLPLTARTVQHAVAGHANRPTSSPHQAGASPRGSPRMISQRYPCSSLPGVTMCANAAGSTAIAIKDVGSGAPPTVATGAHDQPELCPAGPR
jgi:hypothetical protein